jgi:hypothetical protein
MNFKDIDDLSFKQGIDEDSDFIPLLSSEDEDLMQNEKIPEIEIVQKKNRRKSKAVM